MSILLLCANNALWFVAGWRVKKAWTAYRYERYLSRIELRR